MRSKTVLVLASGAVLVGAGSLRAEAPSSAPADDKLAERTIKAPVTIEEIAKRQAELAEELAAKPLTTSTRKAATQPIHPATQPEDVATNLWFALKQYDAMLKQQKLARERLDELKSAASIADLKKETDQLRADTQRLTENLEAKRAPDEVGALAEVVERYKKTNQDHDTQVQAKSARQEQIDGLAERQKAASAKSAEARKQLDEALKQFTLRATTAKAGPERNRVDFERRLAQLNYEIALAESEGLNLEEQLLGQQQRRESRRLEALTPYVQTLRRWMNELEEAAAAGELKRIERRLQSATKEHERLYWSAAREIQIAYKQFEEYDNPTRDRFPQSEFGKLENAINRARRDWQHFVDSLPRRSGQEVMTRYKEIRKKLENAHTYDDGLNDRLDLSIDEREAVYLLRDKVEERLDQNSGLLAKEVAKTTDEQATKLEDELAERRAKLNKHIADITELQSALIERLTEAVDIHGKHVDLLERTRSRLYWSYLMVRDQGIIRLKPDSIRSEWAQGGQRLREDLRSAWDRCGDQLGQAPGWRWAITVLLFVAAIPLGWHIHRTQVRRAVRLEGELAQKIRDKGIEAAGIDDRFKLAVTRLVGQTPLLVCPLVALLADLFILKLSGLALRLVASVILLLLGIRLYVGVVQSLFLQALPRFRVVRCSNKIAGYYRQWLWAFLGMTVLVVPVPLLLYLLDTMQTTRMYLWQVYKALALLIILLFLLRKQRVLKVVGRPENLRARWLYSLIAGMYPVIPMGVLGLLALAILGYGALTSYLIRNAVLTLSVVMGVTILTRYVAELARKYRSGLEQQRQAQRAANGATASAAAISAGQEVALTGDEAASEGEFLVTLAGSLFNWAVRIAGLILILGVWGITLVEIQSVLTYPLAGSAPQIVSLWRVVAAGMAFAGGILVSRSLRSVLNTRVYPVYPMLDSGARAAINKLLHYLLVVVGIYAAMQLLYIQLGALTVLVGTLGLGLGLGLQPLFINFISGLMIFFERHIKVGDIVEVGDRIGEVTNISMRSTSIKTFDNIDMVIPNADFITSQVVNWSLQDRQIRGNLTIGVAYGSNAELVRKLLLQVADEHSMVLKDPAPSVWFTDFGDSALMFRLNVWFGDLSDRVSSLTEMRFTIDKLFAEHGINIPFPQQTLSLIDDKPLRVEVLRPNAADPPQDEPPPR